jgi:hypothetical protein
MYGHIGLRATLLGASASGVAGVVGAGSRLPAPLRPLLLLTSGGLALYLSVSVALLVMAVAFRLHATRDAAPDPATTLWPVSGAAAGRVTAGRADAQPSLLFVPPASP